MNIFHHKLSWFYWDPPREAFTIPYIDHPIVWYGVLFVTGFILAYFIINPILARFLIQTAHLSALDIVNWPRLLQVLRSSSSPLVAQIRKQLSSSPLQQDVLAEFNRLLQSGSVTRDQLCQAFEGNLATAKHTAYLLTDRLIWFVVTGTVVGARLGAVFFYDWPYFRENPIEIFKVWYGGLASHGGTVGVLISLFLYRIHIRKWIPQLTFLRLCDYLAIPTALVGCFIRLGNFMNQEILGTPTDLPWGVIFGHPTDKVPHVPLHPIQLYEAAAYLFTFVFLWKTWKNQNYNEYPGSFLGLFFILVFGSRFILEFWKAPMDSILESPLLQMGQILSIPFILCGILLFWKSKKTSFQDLART